MGRGGECGDERKAFGVDAAQRYREVRLELDDRDFAGHNEIEIATSGVTIDLMGFDVGGPPGSLDGISATALITAGWRAPWATTRAILP